MIDIKIPEWVEFLKAGVHREKSWEQTDWYYRRLASTLRKVSLMGPIGIAKLGQEYGGSVDKGSKRYHPASGSRFIVRHMLNALESLGYVKKDAKGRMLSPKGMSLVEKTSTKVMKELVEKNPELKKYL
ncbi:30S ribosomal protein S19e [mine drainage metagenome]|uniref:30S ribosomal protein S19e n=1 Tax=mine drainage metagenome TaxID=410659 RepID=T0ZRN1_9ZZZZ